MMKILVPAQTPSRRACRLRPPRKRDVRASLTANQRGQSIAQVLVAVALMGIVMAAFTTLIATQMKESKALAEKLAALDLQQFLTASLADGSVCAYVLNNPTVLTFNSTSVSPATPQTITLPNPRAAGLPARLYSAILPNPAPPPTQIPGAVAVEVGQPASAISSSLIVASIQLQILSGTGGRYKGNWLINFDRSKTVRALNPVSVAVTLTADISAPGAAKVTGCQSGNSSGNVAIAVYGTGDRCKNDAMVSWCSMNPETGIWNNELCEGRAWLQTYGGEIRWNAAGNGYTVVPVGCPVGTICPYVGVNPYKIDAFCLQGLQ